MHHSWLGLVIFTSDINYILLAVHFNITGHSMPHNIAFVASTFSTGRS